MAKRVVNFNPGPAAIPLDVLKKEKPGQPMHKLIQNSHHDYDTIGNIYGLMGRNLGKRRRGGSAKT